ncbi:MAG: Uma2 family endonuclease [Acidobacteriota bacterium]
MSTALRSKSPIAPKNKPKAKLKAEPQPRPRRPKTTPKFEFEPLVIHFGPLKDKITDDEFFKFCMRNRDLRIEMSKEGEMIIMMGAGGEGGNRNFKLTARLGSWVEADGTGEGFDSSTEFSLPNGAKRSPDFSRIRRERWEALSAKQREEFPPICPDFVVELRSRTDRLPPLKKKMEEYIANGAQLGWLIDPLKKKVHIYRPNAEVEILDKPKSLSGEPLLKRLKLNLSGILD